MRTGLKEVCYERLAVFRRVRARLRKEVCYERLTVFARGRACLRKEVCNERLAVFRKCLEGTAPAYGKKVCTERTAQALARF